MGIRNKSPFLAIALVFIGLVSSLVLYKLAVAPLRATGSLYHRNAPGPYDCKQVHFSNGTNEETFLLVYGIDAPCRRLKNVLLEIKTARMKSLGKEQRNDIYLFAHLETPSGFATHKYYFFREPLGKKKNRYVINLSNRPAYTGKVKGLMIGPFSDRDTRILRVRGFHDPLFELTHQLRSSKLLKPLLPAILLAVVACAALLRLLASRIGRSLVPWLSRVLPLLFFAYLLSALYFPLDLFLEPVHAYGSFNISSLAAAAFFLLALLLPFKPSPIARLIVFSILLLWVLHVLFLVSNFEEIRQLSVFFSGLVNRVLPPIMLFVTTLILFHKIAVNPIVRALFISLCFLCLLGVVESLLQSNLLYDNVVTLYFRSYMSAQWGRISVTMLHPMVFAAVLILYLPGSLIGFLHTRSTGRRVFFLAACALLFTAVMLTLSRAAALVAVLALLAVLCLYVRKMLTLLRFVLPATVLLALVLFVASPSLRQQLSNRFLSVSRYEESVEYKHRLKSFDITYRSLQQLPFFGRNLGRVEDLLDDTLKHISHKEWRTTDNYYLYILIERGLLGFITLFAPIGYIAFILLRYHWYKRKHAMVLAFFLGTLFFMVYMFFLDGLNWAILYTHFYAALAMGLLLYFQLDQ